MKLTTLLSALRKCERLRTYDLGRANARITGAAERRKFMFYYDRDVRLADKLERRIVEKYEGLNKAWENLSKLPQERCDW